MKRVIAEEGGSYFVLAAILFAALISVAGLVLGIGALTAVRSNLSTTADAVSLAFLEGYLAVEDPDLRDKTNGGIRRAEEILNLTGRSGFLSGPRGTLRTDDTGTAGKIVTGTWYSKQPDSGPVAGCSEYPCFLPGTGTVNAVKTYLYPPVGSSLLVPFGDQFRGLWQNFMTTAESPLATMIPRCTVFLLDVSGSSTAMTHSDRKCSGEYSYYVGDAIQGMSDSEVATKFRNCSGTLDISQDNGWCGLGFENSSNGYIAGANRGQPNNCGSDAPDLPHYRSDYSLVSLSVPNEASGTTNFTRYMVDTTTPPQPLTTFLNSFNAAAQQLKEHQVVGDVTALIAFDKFIVGNTGFLSSPDLIMQLTNVKNAGYLGGSVVHPNFLDFGAFPQSRVAAKQRAFTNLILALETAAELFEEPGACPALAKRNIIIASDGLGTCVDTNKLRGFGTETCAIAHTPTASEPYGDYCLWKFGPHTLPNAVTARNYTYPDARGSKPCVYCPPGERFDCQSGLFQYYQTVENQLMDLSNGSIFRRLIDGGIQITPMLYSNLVKPNFLSIQAPDGHFIDPEEAAGFGYDGLPHNAGPELSSGTVPSPGFSPFVAWNNGIYYAPVYGLTFSGVNNQQYGDPNSTIFKGLQWPVATWFTRPNGLMAELAFRTSGIFCPITERPADRSWYVPTVLEDPTAPWKLSDSYRGRNTYGYTNKIEVPLYYRTPQEQAYDCMNKAIGINPFAVQSAR